MDCCGMPLAVRAGGGYVCRRCQTEFEVPVGSSRNPFARAVSEAPAGLDVVVNAGPTIMRALDYGVGQGPPAAPAMIPVEQPKVSGFGRGGRKGGPK